MLVAIKEIQEIFLVVKKKKKSLFLALFHTVYETNE